MKNLSAKKQFTLGLAFAHPHSFRRLKLRLVTFFTFVSCGTIFGAQGDSAPFREIRPVFERYCFDCHDGDKPKAEVNLEQFVDDATLWRDPKLWERVLVQLRDRVMPPAKKQQPSTEERAHLVGWLQDTLENADLDSLTRDPGRIVIHRLSRLEYNNTIRDLLGVDTHPADDFPPDGGGGGGFDNNSTTLFVAPILIEKYLAAAAAVLAVADPDRICAVRPNANRDEQAAAKENLIRFASRAFRRPVGADEIAGLLNLYEGAKEGGASFEDALKCAARGVLVSPRFLFRIEAKSGGTEPSPIDDYELASRLSYFLWSSMPDDELLRVAADEHLRDSATLAAQVRRMLADAKARSFAENFTTQWLRTKELHSSVSPAADKFPQFTATLRAALYEEPIDFFYGLLRENRSLIECLDADYTYANEVLAAFYGLEGVRGEALQRVSLNHRKRGGVLGMGSVLTLTSYPRRTSPVLRGKWVLEEILGTPPPPPPPMVSTKQVGGDAPRNGLTFRQRLEQHRADPKCAGCHARMDPLGFGLENFDAIGAWRTDVAGTPVDAAGQLVTGEHFDGPVELKQRLLEHKDEFIRNLTEKMLSYALGRGIEPCDWSSVRKIARAVRQDEYRAEKLVLEIVCSYPFQFHRPAEDATPANSTP